MALLPTKAPGKTGVLQCLCMLAAAGASSHRDMVRISREAYVYGYPLAENYNSMWDFALDKNSTQFRAPLNVLNSEARVFTPKDTAVTTPNSDTPYSWAWLDLRAEPVVLTVPAISKGRYWTFQFIDWYTFNFAYVGTRVTGNNGGNFLIVFGNGTAKKPDWAARMLQSETPFVLLLGRTQLFNSSDLENVKAIQAQYRVEPLSKYLSTSPPPPAPAIQWPRALGKDGNKGAGMFKIMDFMLAHLPVDPSERTLRERFLSVGLGSGKFSEFRVEDRVQVERGMAEVEERYEQRLRELDAGTLSSGDLFGTRRFLFRQGAPISGYMARFVGARRGLYGNSREEALYFFYSQLGGEALDGSKRDYSLTLTPTDMSMARAFWSLTLYDSETQLLVENPIERYLVNSGMVPGMRRGPTGDVVIHVCSRAPGPADASNWLPAPRGAFFMVLRMYLPSKEVLSGQWQPPELRRTGSLTAGGV